MVLSFPIPMNQKTDLATAVAGARSSAIAFWMLLFLFASAGPSGCTLTPGARMRAITRGKALFQLHCCGCHNGKRSDLAKLPPDLEGIFSRRALPSGAPATDTQVRSTILEGRSEIMPAFKDSLSKGEIDDIIRYLHTVMPGTRPCATN